MNLKCAIVDDEPLALNLLRATSTKPRFWSLPANTPVQCKR